VCLRQAEREAVKATSYRGIKRSKIGTKIHDWKWGLIRFLHSLKFIIKYRTANGSTAEGIHDSPFPSTSTPVQRSWMHEFLQRWRQG
jgi:hypothetical protein